MRTLELKKQETEHPYDRAKRQYNEILAGTKTLWECLREIIDKKKENRYLKKKNELY